MESTYKWSLYFFYWTMLIFKFFKSYQFWMEGTRIGLLHLSCQEVGEPLWGEPVNVVDGVTLSRQGVDKHPGASGDGSLGDFKERTSIQASWWDSWDFRSVRPIPRIRDSNIHHLEHRIMCKMFKRRLKSKRVFGCKLISSKNYKVLRFTKSGIRSKIVKWMVTL